MSSALGLNPQPERRFSEALASAFPGRVYLVGFYTPAPGARGDVQGWYVDDVARLVTLCYLLAAIELVWRRIGLGRVLGDDPVPLLDPGDAIDLTSYGDDAGHVYRPGFDDFG
jgi:hypothetical protein